MHKSTYSVSSQKNLERWRRRSEHISEFLALDFGQHENQGLCQIIVAPIQIVESLLLVCDTRSKSNLLDERPNGFADKQDNDIKFAPDTVVAAIREAGLDLYLLRHYESTYYCGGCKAYYKAIKETFAVATDVHRLTANCPQGHLVYSKARSSVYTF